MATDARTAIPQISENEFVIQLSRKRRPRPSANPVVNWTELLGINLDDYSDSPSCVEGEHGV